MTQRFIVLSGNNKTVRDTVEHNNIHLGFPEEAISVCAMLNVLDSTTALKEKLTEQTTILYHQAQRIIELTELLEIEEEKNAKLVAHIKESVPPPVAARKATANSSHKRDYYKTKSGAPSWQT